MKIIGNNSENGFATLIALTMVTMLSLLGIAALSTSDDEVAIAGNELQEARAFYAAEAGLEAGAAALLNEYATTGAPPIHMPQATTELNNCIASYATIDNGPVVQRPLTEGTLSGLNAQVKSFTINSIGVALIDNSKMEVSQTFEAALVPIFQFAVFYNNDLEIAPGPTMSLIGRVHTNGGLWVQSDNSLQMDSYVTAVGSMLHGRKGPGAVDAGDVQVKDATGTYVSMNNGSDWIDATHANWYDSSISKWNGRVQDSTHGQKGLHVPLNGAGDDPHKLIEREAGNPDSYEAKATLKFIDGQAFQLVGGVWNDVTADMIAKGIITPVQIDKFYDGRELEWVETTELDMAQLYADGYGPSNGVIYFADDTAGGEFPALRINNADSLGAALTIASENPVYVKGDYNSLDKKPASILADAVTFLSSAFDDSKSNLSKVVRIAVPTTANVSIMTGNVETTAADYNGGLENLPRFLETWTGKALNWSGSMVNFWNSVQADGTWDGTYYSPPIRNWSYDTDLDNPANHPPETPVVRVFQRIGWVQKFVGLK